MRTPRIATALVLLVATAMLWTATARAATTRHVSPAGHDTGDCTASPCKTIGYAISQSVSGDTIWIAAGTYAERVVVDRSLTLQGAGSAKTYVDGSGNGTVITITSSSASLTVTISGLTVQNGFVTGVGGGIYSAPGASFTNDVMLRRIAAVNNVAEGLSLGGGIYNGAGSSMSILESTVANNSVIGEIAFETGEGGGIYNAGTLSLSKSTVSGNDAQGGAGGFFFACLSGNTGSGGGLWGAATIANSTIANNTAYGGKGALPGGLCHLGSPGGNGTGGGIEARGAITLINSTVAGNGAFGGVGTGGHASGTGSGGGIHIGRSGSVSVTNTILASGGADVGPDCDGSVVSGGHNLLGSDAACSGFTGLGDLVNLDPILGPLSGNGGPTQTIALLSGSPAIDAADDAVCAVPPVNGRDQRGVRRSQGPHCDIGAYEKQ